MKRRVKRPAVENLTVLRYVEDWVDPTEPAPGMPEEGPRRDRDPLPGEPVEAVAWRCLAEERLELAITRQLIAERHRPRPDVALEGRIVRTRDQLPAEAREPCQEPPARPLEEVGRMAFVQGGVICPWRDVHAFLTKIP